MFQVRWKPSSERHIYSCEPTQRQWQDRAHRARHATRVLAKNMGQKVRVMENPKDNPKVPRVPEVRTKVRVGKLVCLVLKNRNQRQVQKHKKLHRGITLTILTLAIPGLMVAGVMTYGLMIGARFAGTKLGKVVISLQKLSLGGLIVPVYIEENIFNFFLSKE